MVKLIELPVSSAGEINKIESECFVHPWSKESISASMEKPGSVFLGAYDGDNLVGYIGLECVLDEGYVTNLAVLPQFRRQGTARLLVSRLIESAEERSLSFVTLEVRASNQPAINLYTSLGFIEAGRRRSYYRDPCEDALLLTKYFR